MDPQNQTPIDVRKYVEPIGFFFRQNRWFHVGCLVVAAIAFFYLVAPFWISSPTEIVEQFKTAVEEQDAEAVADLIVTQDETLEVDAKDLQGFIQYAHANPEYWNGLITRMNTLAQSIETHGVEGSDMGSDFYVSLVENPFFYDTYGIGFSPYFIHVNVVHPQTVVKVNGKKVFTSTSQKMDYQYGPLVPGTYQVAASKKYEFTTVHANDTVVAIDRLDKMIEPSLDLQGTLVTVTSILPNTKIFINGKDTGQTIDDYSKKIGPVSFDGKTQIYGVSKVPWGTAKSYPITLKKDEVDEYTPLDITPVAFSNPAEQKKITQQINQFYLKEHEAYLKKDASVLPKEFHDNLKTPVIEKVEQLKTGFAITDLKGEILGTRISFGHAQIEQDENNDQIYYAKIPVEIHKKTNQFSYAPIIEHFDNEFVRFRYNAQRKKWEFYSAESPLTISFKETYFNDPTHVVETKFK